MKKHLVSYSNCQGIGLLHLLKMTPLADEYEMTQINNWQLILLEQKREWAYEMIKKADIILSQPTDNMLCTDGVIVPSSEDLFKEHNPIHAPRVSYGYIYNAGFFPFIKAAPGFDGWIASNYLRKLMKHARPTVMALYDADNIYHDCALRFTECLHEQARREKENNCTIRMSDYILNEFQNRQLFISQNHPTTAVFVEMARRFLTIIDRKDCLPALESIAPGLAINEANLPCGLPVHPAVERELGLKYPADADQTQYRKWLAEWIENPDR